MTDQPIPAPDEAARAALPHGRRPRRPGLRAGLRPSAHPKERMTIERVRMPEQDARSGAANFREVNLGYTEQLAVLEAERCLQCKNPVVHRRLPGPGQHPALHRAPADRRHGRCGASRSSATTRSPASPVGSARRRSSARASASGPRRARRSRSAPSSATSPTGRWTTRRRSPAATPTPTGRKVAIVGSGPAGLTAAGSSWAAATTSRSSRRSTRPAASSSTGSPSSGSPRTSSSRRSTASWRPGVKIETNAIIGQTYTLASCASASTPSSSPSAPACRSS